MTEFLYVYPMRVKTSFNLVASKHFEYLSKIYKDLRPLDENVFPNYLPMIKTRAIIHPLIYVMEKVMSRYNSMGVLKETYYRGWRDRYSDLIGFDVCDSDKMSSYAVELINKVNKVAVPSTHCVKVYQDSGVKAKVYWIPHGVDREWYENENVWLERKGNFDPQLVNLYEYKKKTGKKILLFWLWHSSWRKGWDKVVKVYKRIRKERDDVVLVVKVVDPNIREFQDLQGVEFIKVWNWFDDFNKMALYDLADIVLNFSRGGAWEINCSESLARGVPCVSPDYGSWLDYEHPRFLIKRGKREQPLPGNHIHVGHGYSVDVDDAVAKINEILDNLDEYKIIAEDHRQKLKEIFVWDKIVQMIVKMIEDS